jgi:hypothetical protein
MPDTPRFGIRFKPPSLAPADADATRADAEPASVPIYRRAVELAARAHEVIEAAAAERFFLRDQLDRKSSMVPQLIAQGLAVADMTARRQLFRHARRALTDCTAILDMLVERGSAPREAVAGARGLASALLDDLLALTATPPKQW